MPFGHTVALVLSCTFFMLCSAGMMIVNKLVLRAIPLPVTVVMIQMAFTVLVLCITPCSLHFGSQRDVVRWACTIPWLFAVMLASSMYALSYASMGAIVVIRNAAPLVSMLFEGTFTKEKIELDVWTVLALLSIVGGVVLYVSNDIAFSGLGMGCMLINMTAAILERMLQRKMIAVDPIDVSKTGMMLLNNSVSMLPMSALLLATAETAQWPALRALPPSTWLLLLASCVNAVAISWAGINCQAYVTATTFLVLSNLNKFVVVGFGVVVLHEAKSWQAILGCTVALAGGAAYARARSNLASRSDKGGYTCQQNEADAAGSDDEELQPTLPPAKV